MEKYLQLIRKTELKIDLSHFSSFNITSYFIYTDLITSLPDPRLVDPGSILFHVGANNSYCVQVCTCQ